MNTVNRILTHTFFLYGMVFISTIQLLNFYNANSLLCLGTFGVTYYLTNTKSKNIGICLLVANLVSIFLLGCEKSDILKEGNTSRAFQQGDKCTDFKEIDPNNAKYWENCPTDAAPDGLGCVRNDDARNVRMRCKDPPNVNIRTVTEPFMTGGDGNPAANVEENQGIEMSRPQIQPL